MTLAGIEPATFRFVAQHFNHCATPETSRERDKSQQIKNFLIVLNDYVRITTGLNSTLVILLRQSQRLLRPIP